MDNPCTCYGTLSQDDFQVAARALSERWKEVNPTLPRWMWVPYQTIGASYRTDGYLSLENIYHLRLNEAADQPLFCEESHCSEEDPTDSATLVQNHNENLHVYDFHILYSFSYRVPVLYFRGYKSDGQPVHINDIEKDLPLYSSETTRESKWTFVTQEEHPLLRQPWFMLHPCGTGDWMELLLHSRAPTEGPVVEHYLVSWISVVGQAVGLRIPLELQNYSPSTHLI